MQQPFAERCTRVELLVLDVDGVLSDGAIIVDDLGVESKQFHVRDGAGIAYWRRMGKRVAIISGRSCAAVGHRASELGIERVYQGRLDKLAALEEVLAMEGLSADRACVVGDDLADIASMRAAGVSVAVADAVQEVRAVADHVTQAPGGRGAVREVIELLLRLQGTWPQILSNYQGS
jgi:3-deoxy-D-manno-octulosonate 8-phosphate phosphatase (KDO 8-P phosphatase)